MKNFLIFLVLLLTVELSGQNAMKSSWENLFNGKDLTGWKQLNGKAPYKVTDNMIIGTAVLNEPNSFLATQKEYGDFILELEFNVDSPMNSGIQFRSLSSPEYMDGRVHGYQLEIDPSPRQWTGGIYDEARRGWLYPLEYNPDAKPAFKNGQWNKFRLECIGNSIRSWLNGKPAANLVDDVTPRGFIALQVHAVSKPEEAGLQIRWKNIRIQTKNIKASPPDDIFVFNTIPNNISQQEKRNGVVLLWDGETAKGWQGTNSDKFPEKGWKIENGELSVQAGNNAAADIGGDIITEKKYGSFDLQFEFKITDSANSGVKYFVTVNDKNNGAALGLEYQLLDDEKHPDAKSGSIGNRKMASLYDLIPSLQIKNAQRKVGEWNYGRVIVYPDNRIEHWLNGYKVVEYQRGTPYFYALVARSKYAAWPAFGMADKGYILLQDHGNLVYFRSIKIRELK